ncbi:MAG: sensor histidine kinase [Myxococcota bacterium]
MTVTHPIDLSRVLRARLTPVAVMVLAVVWLAIPLGWGALRVGELRALAQSTGVEVADLVQREVSTRPRLWRYDTIKLAEHVRNHLARPDVVSLVVVDGRGVALDVTSSAQEQAPGRILWTRVPLTLPGEGHGAVWVGLSAGRLLQGALAQGIVFGLLGLALAWLIRTVPLLTVRRAEERISGLVGELDGLNQTLAARVAAAVQALEASQARLRELAARSVGLQEEERRRIALDLHDGLGQTLTGLRLRLQVLRETSDLAAATRQATDDMLRLADESIEETRRTVRRLAPPLLSEVGLGRALQRHCQALHDGTGLPVQCSVEGTAQVPAAIEVACFRIAQEALTNAARHAEAQCIQVRLQTTETGVELTVRDDGQGFDLQKVSGAGLGLVGMRERVELLGGRFEIDAKPGAGTRVHVVFPAAVVLSASEANA